MLVSPRGLFEKFFVPGPMTYMCFIGFQGKKINLLNFVEFLLKFENFVE